MANLKIMNSREKKNLLELIRDQYGFEEKLDYVFLINKKNKIFIATPDISKIDFDKLRVNSFGIYFAELYNESVRFSIEGAQIIGPKATKNVVELNDEDLKQWVQGFDLETTEYYQGFVIIKHKQDYYTCGKTKEGKLWNYLPKARSLRVVND